MLISIPEKGGGAIPPARNGDLTMDMNVSEASLASFMTYELAGHSGCSVSGAGDVNGDGYDDLLISATTNGAPVVGRIYLIFGKESGWEMDINLSNADASFISETHGDWAGGSISGTGDVNGDGFDDILIAASINSEGGVNNRGQVYLIFGKATGWSIVPHPDRSSVFSTAV
jgi:hypothetical protein